MKEMSVSDYGMSERCDNIARSIPEMSVQRKSEREEKEPVAYSGGMCPPPKMMEN